MSSNGLTHESLKQQHAAVIPKSNTFEAQGVSEQDARAFLDTNEGAMYWYRVAEAAAPGTHSSAIDGRALEHLTSGLELPRMETLSTHEPLLKIVPAGTSPSVHSPFWAKEAELDAAVASGKNLSEHFGLPIASESPSYDVYRITPKVSTQIFVNTVAPTSELGGLVTKTGGAEQSLVPNRQLFTDPVYVRSVDNTLDLAASMERGGLSPNLVRSASALGAAAVAFDATRTASHASDLLRQGNRTGATSQVEHFGARNLGAFGGAVLGAEPFGAAGAETGPLDLLIGGAGAIVGAVGGDKLANAWDDHKIYSQTDPQGQAWHLDPKQPQAGWTRTVTDAFAERGLSRTHVETAPPALAERLTFQANNTAVELALAHPATPRDPYMQAATSHDTPSRTDAPWVRDAQTRQWSRTVVDAVMEHGLKSTHVEVATPLRTTELDAAARRTMADNLAASPRGIAEHYRQVYEQRGWRQQGAMPDAVGNALKTPENTLQASDGKTYTRSANDQWTAPGRFWGTNQAEGNIRAELEATAQLARTVAPAATTTHEAPAHAPTHPVQASGSAATPAPPIPAHLQDFRHPSHPMHDTYRVALAHVHAMEDRGRMPHGDYSERTAAAIVDKLAQHQGELKGIEMHGKGQAMEMHLITAESVTHYQSHRATTPMSVHEAVARPVEQVSRDWSRRELPHIHQPQAIEPEAPARDPATLHEHDPRRPDHPRHAQFEALRERIGDAYASYGIERSDSQLDRAAAAVMLDQQKQGAHWQTPDQVRLLPDPQTGRIGPGSGVLSHDTQSFMHMPSVTPASAMQQAPEQTFVQLDQVAQQQALQTQAWATQRQAQQTQGFTL